MTEDQQDNSNPHKLFPDKPHLKCITEYWMAYKRLCVPKSRQMSASWLFCALYLWDAMFHLSRSTFFCSKKENDAEALCDRTYFMYSNLPLFFREFVKIDRTFCSLKFNNRSFIKGVPQGADQLRGYSVSGLFVDEAVYIDELMPMLMSAIPAIGQNGRISLVSSAGPSSFGSLVFDQQ